MSITDELREWISSVTWLNDGIHHTCDKITAIADRIDAEHERACAEAWDNGYESDYLGIEKWLVEHPQAMEHHGWIRLPKDADGEVIHVGDEVYDCNESPSEKYSVAVMELNKWGWLLIDSYGERNEPGQCFHHHTPTVEDVLREFTDAILEWSGKSGTVAEVGTWSDVAAEYVAKLRLAGDAE